MRIINFLVCITIACVCGHTSTHAQAAYTEIYPNYRIVIDKEKLNVNAYRNEYVGTILDYTYTKPDGTKIQVKSYKRNSEVEVFETPPAPAIHSIYKIFYPNGSLKEKGVYLPYQVRIGHWFKCDSRGNCRLTDYESGRNIFGYNKVLEFLEENGYYNKTDGNNWTCTFWHSPAGHTWGVRVNKNGHQYKMYTFDDKGIYDVIETDMYPNTGNVPIVGKFEQAER